MPHPTSVSRLCEIGNESNESVRNGFGPGTMLTRSHPVSRKTGHSKSASVGAANRVPSEVRGATRLAASPRAKCPMNTVRLRCG